MKLYDMPIHQALLVMLLNRTNEGSISISTPELISTAAKILEGELTLNVTDRAGIATFKVEDLTQGPDAS